MISEQFKNKVLESDFEDIISQNRVKDQLKSALYMDRHIILVGQPGIGKTTLAKNVAKLMSEKVVCDCSFNCSPDNPFNKVYDEHSACKIKNVMTLFFH